MRVLHLDTGLTMRGGQAQLMMLVRHLRTHGIVQTVACPATSQLAVSLQNEGFDTIAPSVFTVRRFLQSNRHDIIAAHDAKAQTISYLATLGLRIGRIADRLVTFEPRNRLIHRLKYTHTCDVVIASSQAAKDAMLRNGVPADHIEVIRGGIDFPETLPDAKDARVRMRAKWKLAPDAFVVGHLAAFTAEKGQMDAVEALRGLAVKHPELRMIFGGDGPLWRQVKTAALHLPAHFPGYIQPDADFYAGLDLFLANSTSEALGLAPLFAMAHGVPVIASNVGGLPEVIGAGGWLIPPDNVAILANTMERLMTDPTQRLRAAERARGHARGFDSLSTANRTLTIYHRFVV